jgi:hypothetical protein
VEYNGCPTAAFSVSDIRLLTSVVFEVLTAGKATCLSEGLVPTVLNVRCFYAEHRRNSLIHFLEQSSAVSQFGSCSAGQEILCRFIKNLKLSLYRPGRAPED